MLFLLFTSEVAALLEVAPRMSLPQLKALLQAARVSTGMLPPEKLEDVYTSVQAAPGALARCACGRVGEGAASLVTVPGRHTAAQPGWQVCRAASTPHCVCPARGCAQEGAGAA
jgi:hypothetical protein